jgi:hypothetical protein
MSVIYSIDRGYRPSYRKAMKRVGVLLVLAVVVVGLYGIALFIIRTTP